MTSPEAHAAVLTVTGNRYPLIWNEIGRGEYPDDLDSRLTMLANDLARELEKCGELTDKRKARLAEVPEKLRLARVLLAEKNDFRVIFAFQTAAHCVNGVCLDVTRGHGL
jgi:hypothetical protein